MDRAYRLSTLPTLLSCPFSKFPLVGTTAYWLPALNTDDDIDFALGNISQAGFNVVRTWAFNGALSFAYFRLRLPDRA
jgi:hypothetical protein